MKAHLSKTIPTTILAGALAFSLTGCAARSNSQSAPNESNAPAAQSANADAASSNGTDASKSTTASNSSSSRNSAIDTSELFSNRDLKQTADTSNAKSYTVTSGQDVEITEEGVYLISGTADNASIVVNASKDAKIQLVLDEVSISNSNTPAIYVKSADKVFITTAEGTTNTLSVTGEFTADEETNTDAVIFSKDDITLNGLGTLNINSTDHGVSCKDDLTITGGTYNVTSTSHAFEANDSIAIADGTFNISTEKDGFNCGTDDDPSGTDDDPSGTDDDPSVGFICIEGGTFEINTSAEAGTDGIQATTIAQIDGGTFNIRSAEGIEATYVLINDGNITISASDDGINAARKSSEYDVVIEINGGNIDITMDPGDTDGLDANGTLIINGGNINITMDSGDTDGLDANGTPIINGGNININAVSAFDYDVSGELNGGTVTVNGSQVSELTQQMMGGGKGGMGGMGPRGDMGSRGDMGPRGDMTEQPPQDGTDPQDNASPQG